MKKIRYILTTLITFCIITNVVIGQANPSYVYYNLSVDVYQKPDVHVLAKSLRAQNQLTMTKPVHLGILQPPGFVIFHSLF